MKKTLRGFSTLELLIAFVISIMIVVAVVGVSFGSQYWIIASQTSSEGLYRAKSKLEDLRAAARQSFDLASSTAQYRDLSDPVCAGGGLCYYISAIVSELSPCSKLAHAQVDWKVPGYGTTTSSLYTNLTSPNEIVDLGGDCILNQPSGNWTSFFDPTYVLSSIGTPTGIDVLSGNVYITTATAPSFRIATTSPTVALIASNYRDNISNNAVDVARDESTGRIYAYIARNYGVSTLNALGQLGIVDVTTPSTVASTTYSLLGGTTSDGWRLAFYDRKIYIATQRDLNKPEFFIVDVSNPSTPTSYGVPTDIDTTANGIVVRDQVYAGTTHRFAYLATADDSKEVMVLDYATPSGTPTMFPLNLTEDNSYGTCSALSNKPDAKALFLSGNMLYVGREYSPTCATTPTLYAINVSDPHNPTIVNSKNNIGATVSSIKASGGFLYLGIGTPSVSKLQVWKSDLSNQPPVPTYNLTQLQEQGIDLEGNKVYAAVNSSQPLHIISSP